IAPPAGCRGPAPAYRVPRRAERRTCGSGWPAVTNDDGFMPVVQALTALAPQAVGEANLQPFQLRRFEQAHVHTSAVGRSVRQRAPVRGRTTGTTEVIGNAGFGEVAAHEACRLSSDFEITRMDVSPRRAHAQ